jgi:hypothetical protein
VPYRHLRALILALVVASLAAVVPAEAANTSTTDFSLTADLLALGPSDVFAYAGTDTVGGAAVMKFTVTGSAVLTALDFQTPCQAGTRLETAVAGSGTATVTDADFYLTSIQFTLGAVTSSYTTSSPPPDPPSLSLTNGSATGVSMTGLKLTAGTLSLQAGSETASHC